MFDMPDAPARLCAILLINVTKYFLFQGNKVMFSIEYGNIQKQSLSVFSVWLFEIVDAVSLILISQILHFH